MNNLNYLFENNRRWAEAQTKQDPHFFSRLSTQQSPRFLWIGCSDSRVPANQITGLDPGEMFVHRNVANLVLHTDFNCLSVLQFAVEILKVTDIIVCGHYGCGGVRAALDNASFGLIENWIRNIRNIYIKFEDQLSKLSDEEKFKQLCELNIKTQVAHCAQTTVVQEAWNKGQNLTIHGWVYGVNDGLLKNLNVSVKSQAELNHVFTKFEQT